MKDFKERLKEETRAILAKSHIESSSTKKKRQQSVNVSYCIVYTFL